MALFSSHFEVFAARNRGLFVSWFTFIAPNLQHIVDYTQKVHMKTQHSKVVYFMLYTTYTIVKISAVKLQRRIKLKTIAFIIKLRGYFLSVGLKENLNYVK